MRMNPIFNAGSVEVSSLAPEPRLSLADGIRSGSRSWPLLVSVAVHLLALAGLSYRASRPAELPTSPALVFFDLSSPAAPPKGVDNGSAEGAGRPTPVKAPKSVRRERLKPSASAPAIPAQAERPSPEDEIPADKNAEKTEPAATDASERTDTSTSIEQAAAKGVEAGQRGGTEGAQGSGTGAPGGGQALNLSQVSKPPRVLERVTPDYPASAKSMGLEGLVVVRIILDPQGQIERTGTRIMRSVPALDSAALEAISRWRFSPALGPDHRPVRVQLDIPIQFSLR